MKTPSGSFRPQLEKPRSVYFHLPFCRHRCGYCNFSVVAGRDQLADRYLNALAIETNWLDQRYEVDTVFLGGGTPSHLTVAQLNQLSVIIRERFELTNDVEFTAECNPRDLNDEKLETLASMGVNRISLGVQSLNDQKLRALERDHSADDVARVVASAKNRMHSISLDLIFAAPEETLDDWQTDLKSAIDLAPNHLSTYELTYEKGTQFWNRLNRNELSQADEDLRAAMYSYAMQYLNTSGFQQYEISSFSQNGHRCRHNQVYWRGEPYFALGVGAARYVDGIRETNHQSTMSYMKSVEANQSPVASALKLNAADTARELLSIGLRRIDGVDLDQFRIRTGYEVRELIQNVMQYLVEHNLIAIDEKRIRLTAHGIMLYDSVVAEILN